MTECLPDLPRYVRQRGDEWQGADHPDGPWRPIPAPQSGLPWRTDGPAVPESREPASVAPEARPLSPAAQAVMDAVMGQDCEPYPLIAAAVLRAAAEQSENLYDSHEGKVSVVPTDRILAIAAELEAQP